MTAMHRLLKTRRISPFSMYVSPPIICAMIGFIAGQQAHVTTIGVATVIFVMGTGPMVQLFRSRIMKLFLQKLRKGEE